MPQKPLLYESISYSSHTTMIAKLALVGLLATSLETSCLSFSVPSHNHNQRQASLTMQMTTNADDVATPGVVNRRSLLQSSMAAATVMATTGSLFPASSQAANVGGAIQYGDESIMSPKAHGTSDQPVQQDLLYGVSNKLADKICNYNR